MLSESMLQKFTNKIQNLVSNQQSERSQSQSHVEVINSDDDVVVPNNKSSSSENNRKKQRVSQVGSNDQEESKRLHYDHNNGDYNEFNEQTMKAPSKINIKELSKSIVYNKQSAALSTIRKTVAPPMPSPVKKTVAQGTNTTRSSVVNGPTQPVKGAGYYELPKLAVMNNLIKLSTKLNLQDFLKQIKYQCTLIQLAPIRLLLYFCIEKILYYIYETNGLQKMGFKSKDINFLMEQVNLGFIYLLDYIKTTERPLISRILKGVLNRLSIPQTNQQRWFTDFIKNYRKALTAAGISIQQLEKPITNLNITSNIFIGVPTPDRRIQYSYPSLELENQQKATEIILDPQIYHQAETLFYFKKALNKVKEKATRNGQMKKPDEQKDDSTRSENNYHQKKFVIEITKIQLPLSFKLYSNSRNYNEFTIIKPANPVKPIKPKAAPVAIQEDQVIPVPVKRARPPQKSMLQEIDENEEVEKTEPQITKQQILNIVEKCINSSIPDIAKKIAQRWKIDPNKLKDIIKQSDIARQMPSKTKPSPSQPVAQIPTISVTKLKQKQKQKQKPKQKTQSQSQILREIDTKSTQLQKAGVSHKELVKQIFKILESKNLSHQKKEQVMEKWIAIKKARKNNNNNR